MHSLTCSFVAAGNAVEVAKLRCDPHGAAVAEGFLLLHGRMRLNQLLMLLVVVAAVVVIAVHQGVDL